MRLPRASSADRRERRAVLQTALRSATAVPLETARAVRRILDLTAVVAKYGNPNLVSDAGVAAEAALAGLRGARLNVLINLDGIDDGNFCNEMTKKVDTLLKKGESFHDKVVAAVDQVMRGGNG